MLRQRNFLLSQPFWHEKGVKHNSGDDYPDDDDDDDTDDDDYDNDYDDDSDD